MTPFRQYTLLSALTALLVISVVVALSSGSVPVPVGVIWQQLLDPTPGIEQQILWELRLPRAVAAFVTGGLLALSGVVMQVLLRNPLADPYILGVSGGAAVGALAAILLGVAGIWITQAAFAGALLSVFLVFGLAGRQQWSATRLLLTGVVVSAGWGAVINVMLTTSTSNNVQSMLFWLMGDLSQSRTDAWHFLLLLAGVILILSQARALNALARGELMAAALGVNVWRLKLILYFSASILTATAVTVAGSVGFVGLVIPHMLRLLGARDHRWLVPCSVMLGGSFLLLADSLARTIVAPQQLPVGVLTAMIGVPAFLFILHRGARTT
ncbi:FecCD family ABC transporter permease [Pseudohongiella acticola]|uniref:FecCD family ABC transporter permease n=1 Tax=Pseudohongiella acticola TaxID=1524254 RepID=UPI001FE02B5C|nr:iron ABC transporter permease [Pseudohongiella acticola]